MTTNPKPTDAPDQEPPMTKQLEAVLVERVARAISIPQHHTTWDILTWQEKDLFYTQADYAISAMRSATPPEAARPEGLPGAIAKLTALRTMTESCSQPFYVEIIDGVLAALVPQSPAPSADGELVEALNVFQCGVDKWMDACFNDTIKADVQERCDRFIEEALEFIQAAGYSADRAHALVDYTFGRPQGEINQEVGGVMVTLAAMCNTLKVAIGVAAETELARVWTKIDTIRAKQAAKPTGSALPEALTATAPPTDADTKGGEA